MDKIHPTVWVLPVCVYRQTDRQTDREKTFPKPLIHIKKCWRYISPSKFQINFFHNHDIFSYYKCEKVKRGMNSSQAGSCVKMVEWIFSISETAPIFKDWNDEQYYLPYQCLMMEKVTISKMLEIHCILTYLTAWLTWHESVRSCKGRMIFGRSCILHRMIILYIFSSHTLFLLCPILNWIYYL
jgi:hypothetical protein